MTSPTRARGTTSRRFAATPACSPASRSPAPAAIAEQLAGRPAITVIGIDAPAVDGAANAVVPRARAAVSVRLAPGQDPEQARAAVVAHLQAAAPWRAVLVFGDAGGGGEGFLADTGGPAFAAATRALEVAYGRPVSHHGQGGSIPLVAAFHRAAPGAEMILWGAEEPRARIHAPDESVDLAELERGILAEALFLAALPATRQAARPPSSRRRVAC